MSMHSPALCQVYARLYEFVEGCRPPRRCSETELSIPFQEFRNGAKGGLYPGPRPTASPLHPQPLHEQLLQKPRGVLEAAFAVALGAEHGADLDVEIGIVLGRRPDGED